MLKKVIYSWERKLARRDNNRVVRPFEWGLEFLNRDHFGGEMARADPTASLHAGLHSKTAASIPAGGPTKAGVRPGPADRSGRSSRDCVKGRLQTIYEFN